MSKDDLEAAIEKLRDIEEIKRLHAQYAYLIDEGRLDEVPELFTEDAIGDWGAARGRYEGKEGIARFCRLVPQASSMLRHMFVQPDIEIVDEKRAHATWYLFGFGTYKLPEGEVPAWTHGKYRNEVVKVDGKWKIRRLNFEFTFQTPYHEGWVKRPTLRLAQYEATSR